MKRDLDALQSREFDVLVIGGGIAGAWAVYEAASRGLRAALIEADDFGQATSWASLKTAHGGLRHLQRADLAGFRESVRERHALLRVAPALVRPLGFAVPATSVMERAKYLVGGLANDFLSIDRNDGLPQDKRIGGSKLVRASQAGATLHPEFAGSGAFLWQDAQITHTERLVMAVLQAAVDASAVVANHCAAVGLVPSTDRIAVRCSDSIGAGELHVRSRAIVNAAGAGIESVARLMGETCGSPSWLRGVNVVLDRPLTPPDVALGAKDQGRFFFLVPWLRTTVLGTAYAEPTPTGPGPIVEDLLDSSRRAFPWAGLSETMIRVVHDGLVPRGSGLEPAYRSRIIRHPDPRLISILSAKYTTARGSAEKAIDAVGETLRRPLLPSITAGRALGQAFPREGSLESRLAFARDSEMALTPRDAHRGRVIEAATGEA